MKCIGSRLWVAVLMALSVMLLGSGLFSQDKKGVGTKTANSATAGSCAPLKFEDLRKQVDADKDGFITREEWNQLFQKMDENGDSRLSFAEIQQSLRSEGGETTEDADAARIAAFVRLDVNKNDVIDLSEWTGNKRAFRYLDVNKDKLISRDEFISKKARWWNQTFMNLDLDGNKIITRGEWMDSDSDFSRLDRDHNGGLDRREFYNPR